jgi:tetratricopeptide (TPR) repeat protein
VEIGPDNPADVRARIEALKGEIAERGRVARHGELLALVAELERDSASSVKDAKDLLDALREIRAFDRLHIAASDMVDRGLARPYSNRMKAQALVELGRYDEAGAEIARARQFSDDAEEMRQLFGLEGRIFKQRFVNSVEDGGWDKAALEKAVSAYEVGWIQSGKASAFHGVNMVALLHRAGVDGRPVMDAARVWDLAGDVKAAALEEKKGGGAWAFASLGEVSLALGEYDEADRAYGQYFEMTTDAFKLEGTRRQLDEIWTRARSVPDRWRAVRDKATWAMMSVEKGQVQLGKGELAALAGRLMDKDQGYEALFGGRLVTMKWARRMIEIGTYIGRIERRRGMQTACGTGFVMDAELFSPAWASYGRVLVTNEHVISTRGDGALRPEEAAIRFSQASPEDSFPLGPVLWCSPREHHDVTILALDKLPADAGSFDFLAPFASLSDKDGRPETRERVTVIGHPGGHDQLHLGIENLEVQNLDYSRPTGEPERVQYRCPTLKGNSGSPVLTWQDLEPVAVHHRHIEASGCNEGISLESIREAIEARPEGWSGPVRTVAQPA